MHPLPAAPKFVGRNKELEELGKCWNAGFRGVLALVGLGGAGKTALVARFLQNVADGALAVRPHGLFVWSFYLEPDPGLFLQEACRYFAPPESASLTAKGAGILPLLHACLGVGGPHLLVLDGLERVQRQETTAEGRFGQVEDPLLKNLLSRLADGGSHVLTLVTSRFPLTDLDAHLGRGYRHIDLAGLDAGAARELLRQRGVHSADNDLNPLVESFGAHALTLDHLGGLIGQFLDGDPRRAPDVSSLASPAGDRQALRLARLLRAYEQHLPPAELSLLCRLCLLRRSITEQQIRDLFLCAPAVRTGTARALGEHISSLDEPRNLFCDFRDLGNSICFTLEESLCQAPIAGPEATFRQEVLRAVEDFRDGMDQVVVDDLEEVIRLYSQTGLDTPSDELPLPAEDRESLRSLCREYLELRQDPQLPFANLDPQLQQAFAELGWHPPRSRRAEDLGPADIFRRYQRVTNTLRFLFGKHGLLRKVRDLCRRYQRKRSLAGPLAELDAQSLDQVVNSLVGRHLVLRERNGSLSVHPAVRDHFYRLATAQNHGGWNDLLREQLIGLVRRPGKRFPELPAELDLVEEAIHHALAGGRSDEAARLFTDVLGGLRHLGWKLGEMSRGLRILRQLNPCPDRWALGWFSRALGEFEAAYRHNPLPWFRAEIRLLQGRLPEVAALGEPTRTATAAFLMGQTTDLPPQPMGTAISRDQLRAYLNPHTSGQQAAVLEKLYLEMGWEGDRAHSQLVQAESAVRRQGDPSRSRQFLAAAATWIFHSGSVEHLAHWHLIHARLARQSMDWEPAHAALEEGLHLTRLCSLELFHIELLCEQAELSLAERRAHEAEVAARDAMVRAQAARCQFAWGAAAARDVLARALLEQKRLPEARATWGQNLVLQYQIGDPRAAETLAQLERLKSPSLD